MLGDLGAHDLGLARRQLRHGQLAGSVPLGEGPPQVRAARARVEARGPGAVAAGGQAGAAVELGVLVRAGPTAPGRVPGGHAVGPGGPAGERAPRVAAPVGARLGAGQDLQGQGVDVLARGRGFPARGGILTHGLVPIATPEGYVLFEKLVIAMMIDSVKKELSNSPHSDFSAQSS